MRQLTENELRIGNYVYYCENGNQLYKELYKIDQYDTIGLANGGEIYGVPIREGFLITRFSFSKNGNVLYKHNWFLNISFDAEYNDWHVYMCKDNFHIRTIKYVHELQNLFYATSGFELEQGKKKIKK